MMEVEVLEIREAIEAADNALVYLRQARKNLDSASNWGLLDMFGGGLLSSFMKHSKMDDAQRDIQNARSAVLKFNKELGDIKGYSSIHISEYLKFADIFMDGFVFDIMVQSKINNSKNQCEEAIRQIENIKRDLENKL